MDFDMILRVCSVLPIESERFSVRVSSDGLSLDVLDESRSFKVTRDSLDDIISISRDDMWYKTASVHTTDLACALLTAYMDDGTAGDLQIIKVNKLSKVVSFRIDGGMGEYALDVNTGYCYTIGTNPYELDIVYKMWTQKQYLVNRFMHNMLMLPLLKDMPVGFDSYIKVDNYLAIRRDSRSAWKRYPANHLGLLSMALDYEQGYRTALSQTNIFYMVTGPALRYVKELEVLIPKLNAQGNNNCTVERENGYVLTTLRNGNKVIRIAHHGDFAATYNCADWEDLRALVNAANGLLGKPAEPADPVVVIKQYMESLDTPDVVDEFIRILRLTKQESAIETVLQFIKDVK